MAYSYRLRFALPHDSWLASSDRELVILQEDGRDHVLSVSQPNPEETPIKDARSLKIAAHGYESAEQAQRAVLRAKTAVLVASVAADLGVDCGNDDPTGRLFDAFKKKVEDAEGIRLLPDIHGCQVYEEVDQPTRFYRIDAKATIGRNVENFVRPFQHASVEAVPAEERQITALEVLNAAKFEQSGRARLLTAMTAIEVLAKQADRSRQEQGIIDALVSVIQISALSEQKRKGLIAAVQGLKRESIRSACRALISRALGEGDETLFDELYILRNKVAHRGAAPKTIGSDAEKAVQLARRLVLALLMPNLASGGSSPS